MFCFRGTEYSLPVRNVAPLRLVRPVRWPKASVRAQMFLVVSASIRTHNSRVVARESYHKSWPYQSTTACPLCTFAFGVNHRWSPRCCSSRQGKSRCICCTSTMLTRSCSTSQGAGMWECVRRVQVAWPPRPSGKVRMIRLVCGYVLLMSSRSWDVPCATET